MISTLRNAALRLQLSGVDVQSLRIAGSCPGVVPIIASAANGAGIGTLTVSAGACLSWQAPGSTKPGKQCVAAGGTVMLEDGADASKWIRVTVYPTYLPSSGQWAINLFDVYNNVGPVDVTSAEATAGETVVTEYTLKNVGGFAISAVRLWLDATASGFADLSVSSDGTNYYSPISATDSHVLAWSSITPGASVNVWVKRVTGASAASNPSILNVLKFQWQSLT